MRGTGRLLTISLTLGHDTDRELSGEEGRDMKMRRALEENDSIAF